MNSEIINYFRLDIKVVENKFIYGITHTNFDISITKIGEKFQYYLSLQEYVQLKMLKWLIIDDKVFKLWLI